MLYKVAVIQIRMAVVTVEADTQVNALCAARYRVTKENTDMSIMSTLALYAEMIQRPKSVGIVIINKAVLFQNKDGSISCPKCCKHVVKEGDDHVCANCDIKFVDSIIM